MPLLDIAISQPCSCFGNNISVLRSETRIHNRFLTGYDKGLGLLPTFSWRSFGIKERLGRNLKLGRGESWRGGLMIQAVATFEIAREREGVKEYENVLSMNVDSVRPNSSGLEQKFSSEDSTELDEREKLRRMRISKANKGKVAWNKGRKHSPETLQRIKEKTRLAMQDPKVKMKLVNFGHAQSEETKMKIGVGVRLGWERRRQKLMLQETCHYDWQNLIAVAARKGLLGEEELQWDSYKIFSKQLKEKWEQSLEQRKNTPRPKGDKRAPKSAEQKRKIAEAIAAKWADPEYRNRVCSGLSKFHGTEGVERKPRKKPSGDGQTRKRSPKKKDETNVVPKSETNSQVQRIRSKRSRKPPYKDPLASSKLKMLKNIRAERAAAMNKKSEAVFRARLLIAEAEKAAEALELAAKKNPLAKASLIESRMLIAEAIQLIESIEPGDTISTEKDNDLSENTTNNADAQNLEIVQQRKVNGVHSLSSAMATNDFSFNKFMLQDFINGNASNSCSNDMLKAEEKLQQESPNGFLSLEEDNTANLADPKPRPSGSSVGTEKSSINGLEFQSENAKTPKITKKWVRGRLVDVVEET
ncbi:hypothetical protein CDL12_13638 [Handroanthus impetiginosus]|uniref:Nuclease associated modular domain-containing protein n=1 Tax=Handroanthus impetiginosus TaxID=429701 RepID=A0A2G9H8W5_9LAMI|nr:hypothetical protein CDL12_13638 [Handroanthus impetiginosus]